MGSPIPDKFEAEYAEIKSLVAAAKEDEDAENYKSAKHKYLDAAAKSLQIAKSIDTSEEVTFRNIARILVDQAKEMQQLIEIQKHPLPSIPRKEKLAGRQEDELVFSKKDDPKLLQLMIIHQNGIPMFTKTVDKLSKNVQMKINDILFSGAITAINSLISEVLSKPIQAIQFEDGNIVLKFVDELIFVVFTQGEGKLLEDNIEKFSNDFCSNILPRVQDEVNQGKVLNGNEEVEALVRECFVFPE